MVPAALYHFCCAGSCCRTPLSCLGISNVTTTDPRQHFRRRAAWAGSCARAATYRIFPCICGQPNQVGNRVRQRRTCSIACHFMRSFGSDDARTVRLFRSTSARVAIAENNGLRHVPSVRSRNCDMARRLSRFRCIGCIRADGSYDWISVEHYVLDFPRVCLSPESMRRGLRQSHAGIRRRNGRARLHRTYRARAAAPGRPSDDTIRSFLLAWPECSS